jgi:hypothetical protein
MTESLTSNTKKKSDRPACRRFRTINRSGRQKGKTGDGERRKEEEERERRISPKERRGRRSGLGRRWALHNRPGGTAQMDEHRRRYRYKAAVAGTAGWVFCRRLQLPVADTAQSTGTCPGPQ